MIVFPHTRRESLSRCHEGEAGAIRAVVPRPRSQAQTAGVGVEANHRPSTRTLFSSRVLRFSPNFSCPPPTLVFFVSVWSIFPAYLGTRSLLMPHLPSPLPFRRKRRRRPARLLPPAVPPLATPLQGVVAAAAPAQAGVAAAARVQVADLPVAADLPAVAALLVVVDLPVVAAGLCRACAYVSSAFWHRVSFYIVCRSSKRGAGASKKIRSVFGSRSRLYVRMSDVGTLSDLGKLSGLGTFSLWCARTFLGATFSCLKARTRS